MHAACALDLDRVEAGLSVNDKVHFGAGPGAPEVHRRVIAGVGRPGPQVLCDQTFESLPLDFAGSIQGARWAQRTKDARIEQVESVACDGCTPCPLAKYR